MLVTEKQFFMEKRLVDKLDLMIDRLKRKLDNVILIDGDEGYGKSNLEAGIAEYVSWKTGRSLSVDNFFFSLDKLIDFASRTEEQIICWDEGALGGLASEWWKKNQIDFIKLLMIARKKKHFFIICIPKFFKLNEYLVVDRSIALVHVYARNEIDLGRFVYYNKKDKEKLFYDWRKNKQRNYKKYYSFRGTFLEYLPKVIDEKIYDSKKDDAILNFKKREQRITPGFIKKVQTIREIEATQNFVKNCPELAKRTIAKGFGITEQTLYARLKRNTKEML